VSRGRLLALALAFEGAAFLLTLGIAAVSGTPLRGVARFSPAGVLVGTVSGAVLAGLVLAAMRARWKPLVELGEIAREITSRFFRESTIADLVVISALAGVAEEALFRGAIQATVSLAWGPAAGIAAGALVFGLAHALTFGYAVAAGLMGVAMGILFEVTGDLAAPILSHAVYDLIVLLALRRNLVTQST
jgi:hypothetical protein